MSLRRKVIGISLLKLFEVAHVVPVQRLAQHDLILLILHLNLCLVKAKLLK